MLATYEQQHRGKAVWPNDCSWCLLYARLGAKGVNKTRLYPRLQAAYSLEGKGDSRQLFTQAQFGEGVLRKGC